MKETYYNMFGIIKKMFIILLTSTVSACNHAKCVSLSNQKYEIQPSLINLHFNEHRQQLHCLPFAVKSDKCVGSCNTLMTYPVKYVLNKTEDLKVVSATILQVYFYI